MSEWIAGNLGKSMGLPIPDFKQASISVDLLARSAREDIAELGAGTGFASQMVANAKTLTYIYLRQLDETLRAKILLFDWWTLNGDRTLTADGGNPNILWVPLDQKIYVIDHNLAFDTTALQAFWSTHLFASSARSWDHTFRARMAQAMTEWLKELENLWQSMPAEWTEVETELTFDLVKRILWRFETDPVNFWRTA